MSENAPANRVSRVSGLLSDTLVLFGLILLGAFGGQVINGGILYLYLGDKQTVQDFLAAPELSGNSGRYILLAMQGLASIFTFILPPILLTLRFRRLSLWSFSPRHIVDTTQLFWAILLVPAMAPLLELTITWNKNLHLPAALEALETWAQNMEQSLAQLTTFLIAFSSFPQFLLGLLVIAVLPAIGEELLFRGTLQPMLQRATGSPHRAIWLTAIIFSAIHMQFYGFVPRVLLGALFGYLYYWSGNISVPMLAHFVNNGITIVLAYVSQQGHPNLNPEQLPPAPVYVLGLSVAAGVAVMYRFYKRYHVHNLSAKP